jgi:hypothetical protein
MAGGREAIPRLGGSHLAWTALARLCRQLAAELGPHGVRVNWLLSDRAPPQPRRPGRQQRPLEGPRRPRVGLAKQLVVIGYSVPVTDQLSQALLRADLQNLSASTRSGRRTASRKTEFVNQLRDRADVWRQLGYPHVTGTTCRLLGRA